jgi:multiple sugar transport system ATP-binding protein
MNAQEKGDPMAKVILTNITKRFGDFIAVKNLSMEFQDGKFTVLVGPSGCGKTTALRMIAGLEKMTEGDIRIDGKLVNHIPPKDRDIAMVFQNYAIYPHMNVFSNMAFGLTLRKVSKAEIKKRVYQTAALLGIEDKLKNKPRELSGGQRQRVAVGRAIVRNPKVFLFDEPLSNLDAKLRLQMRTELKQLHHKLKTTTIFVTHDQVEAMTMGDMVAVMKDGVIQQYASPKETYDNPVNMFVAGFIGSPSMNFIPAKAIVEEKRCRLKFQEFNLNFPQDKKHPLPGDIIVGIRPEDLSISISEAENTLPFNVLHTEHLGSHMLVHGHCGKTRITASFDSHQTVKVGTTIWLSVNFNKLHAFDPKTGQALL